MNDLTIFYQTIIKPIEKKYNTYYLLYSFIHLNYFKNKYTFYNKLLTSYYSLIINLFDSN